MPKISSYALTLALITHSATAQTCDGDISTFTGECTYANFVDSLSPDCNVAELFPDADPETEVEELCAYDAPTQFVEIQGTYQRDRRYFAGGGPLVDGPDWYFDSARLNRFETNLGSKTLIAWPEYAARVQYNLDTFDVTNGYPANMNLDTSCELNTAMCCFTDDTELGINFPSTTDVCRHELYESPESNHIKDGWSVFPGSETNTHCVGFSWQDGEEDLIGNMMYDISLRNSLNAGWLKGIPGAPMCGCIEHMPVVEEAACRTATKAPTVEYTFSYDAADGYVTADNRVDITYSDCAGDLKAEYIANQGGDTDKEELIDEHLVGSGGCATDLEDYLNDEQFLHQGQHDSKYVEPDSAEWSDLVVGEGIYFLPPSIDPIESDTAFRELIEAGCKDDVADPERYCIIRRVCSTCQEYHRDIYYKRYAPLPPVGTNTTNGEVYFLDMFMNNWVKYENDMAAGDFALFSTYEDAVTDTNAWTYCDYGNYDGYGFPRNCGPYGQWGNNWNSYTVHGGGHANHHGFYVEKPRV